MGRFYLEGTIVRKDDAEAFKWALKSARQGYIWSQEFVAKLYLDGSGVAKDRSEAMKWLLKAAENGSDGSQCQVGYALASGNGMTKDLIEAYKWYALASEKTNQYAISHLPRVAAEMTPDQIKIAKARVAEFSRTAAK
jgi:TPR repeat protein